MVGMLGTLAATLSDFTNRCQSCLQKAKVERAMMKIDKQDIGHLLLLDYLASLHSAREKLRLFEHKYQTSLDEFSTALKASDQEDFKAWDDYMEWKAYQRVSEDLSQKIDRDQAWTF